MKEGKVFWFSLLKCDAGLIHHYSHALIMIEHFHCIRKPYKTARWMQTGPLEARVWKRIELCGFLYYFMLSDWIMGSLGLVPWSLILFKIVCTKRIILIWLPPLWDASRLSTFHPGVYQCAKNARLNRRLGKNCMFFV